jgi:transposase
LESFVGNGHIWAEVVDDVETDTLQLLISREVSTGSTVSSDTRNDYTMIATRGYVHRLVNLGEKQYSDGKGKHINGLEEYWGFLKRKLERWDKQKKLPLYLAEHIWRYNHRNDSDRIGCGESYSY